MRDAEAATHAYAPHADPLLGPAAAGKEGNGLTALPRIGRCGQPQSREMPLRYRLLDRVEVDLAREEFREGSIV